MLCIFLSIKKKECLIGMKIHKNIDLVKGILEGTKDCWPTYTKWLWNYSYHHFSNVKTQNKQYTNRPGSQLSI